MSAHRLAILVILTSSIAIGLGGTRVLSAQDKDEAKAITARVHGTFQDKAGGLGVLSGDMTVVRFEVRNGTVTAIGEIVGALADSKGDVLGHVDQELAMPVGNVTSSCNQLRMDLAATDSDVLQTVVHFDKEAAGFDSRDGATPKALGVLCKAGALLRGQVAPDALARALNDVVTAVASTQAR
jgi:hypothetical protein